MKPKTRSGNSGNISVMPYIIAVSIVWTTVLTASAIWNANRVDRTIVESARIQARSNFIKDVIYRSWNSMHGGVYAPVTASTRPNPHLDVTERDIRTPAGRKLTKVNPAYMTRQVHELGFEKYGLRAHITSINPIRPENAPDPWEEAALKGFEKGVDEVSSLEKLEGESYLRLMRPLRTEQSCLQCHAKQGYQLNDVRGGISVSVPMQPLWALAGERKSHIVWGHGLIWLLGMGGILFGTFHLRRSQSKRYAAEQALREAYAGLEQEVASRVAELKTTNEALQTEIADRREAERALKENAMRLHLAISSGNVGLWDWDICTNKVFYSAEWKQQIGYEDEEIPNDFNEWHSRVHPEDIEKTLKTIRAYLSDPWPDYQVEYRMRHKDGTYRWIMVRAALIHDHDGKAVRMLGSHVDITELKTVENRLRSQQMHLDTAQRIAKMGSWELDIALSSGTWSDEMFRITGFDPTLGTPTTAQFTDFIHPDDRPLQATMHERVLMTGGPEQFEFRSNPEKGPVKYLFSRLKAVRNGATRPTVIVGTLQDITDRKLATQALEAEKKKFKALIDESPFAAALIGPDHRFEYLNPGFEIVFGYTLTDLPTRFEWFEKAYPDPGYREKVMASWQQAEQEVNPGSIRNQTWTVRCKDGSDKIVQICTTFLATGQKIVIYEDVTEHYHMEERLRQTQKMEAIGTLAGGIAHDFNNILSAILGYADLAKVDLPRDSAVLDYIEEVLKAGTRARNLVQHILAFSRQSKPEKVPLAMHLVVKEALSLLRATIPTTVQISQTIAPAGMILGDADQMHQVVMNLCTNAFQAMKNEDGILTVGLRPVVLDAESISAYPDLSPGSYLQLTVSDTGSGMGPEVLQRIFDPYFTTKAQGKGTGLGLSVVHGIVKSHGGTITVYSEVDKGSTFHVYLPLVEADQKETAKTTEPRLPSGKERILFVDDEPALAELGKKMLSSLGYQVVTRTNAIEAMALVEDANPPFDLVITDMTMPNMSGVELAVKLLRVYPDLPIILCTGFSNTISKARAKDIGIREFAMKPLIRKNMAELVRRVLDEQIAVSI